MQAFTLAAITDAEKNKLRHKNITKSMDHEFRSRSAGQGACLKGMSRTVTMQGFTLAAITDAEKTKL